MELPNEIWDYILDFTDLSSVSNMFLVCNRFFQIIMKKRKDLYKNFCSVLRGQLYFNHTHYNTHIRYLPNGKIVSVYLWINEPQTINPDVYNKIYIYTIKKKIIINISGKENVVNYIEYFPFPGFQSIEYPLENGWISGIVKSKREEINEDFIYDRGIPLLTKEQQEKYHYNIRYKPEINSKGELILDTYMNQKGEFMKRVYEENFISTSTLSFPDKDGIIENKKIRLKVNEPGLRFILGKYVGKDMLQVKLSNIYSRLKFPHMWVFFKAYHN